MHYNRGRAAPAPPGSSCHASTSLAALQSEAMNSSTASKPDVSQPAAKMPGDTVRALVSLWLLFHLFGITLALATNVQFEPATSTLVARIKSAPFLDQYMYALWLDVPHDYRLTTGDTDGDFSIETELVYADGRRETKLLPPADARGERFEHYQALARRLTPPPDVEAADSTAFAYLGGAILKQLKDEGVKEVVFRVRRHAALSMTDAAATVSSQRDPFNPRTYTNRLTVSVTLNSRDEPQAQIQAQAARDVAPVTGPRSSPPTRLPAPPNQDNPAPQP